MTYISNNFISILNRIKSEYEESIKTSIFNGKSYENGNSAKQALIRSKRLISYIHDYIKQEFIINGINQDKIFPPLGQNKPEITLLGYLKTKKQDICIIPDHWDESTKEEINSGPLIGTVDPIGKDLIEKSICANARSQLSSLNKNFDTLYERTFAEAFNLHMRAPRLCMAEVYLIPTHEYDDLAMKHNKIDFKKVTKLEKYIHAFQAINNRQDHRLNHHMYERIWLVIVDFRHAPPKLYSDIKELLNDKLVPERTTATLNKLTIDRFCEDILDMYSQRFDISNLY